MDEAAALINNFLNAHDCSNSKSSGARQKRQVYHDKTYPGKRWSKGVNYFFDNGISEEVKRVFTKAAEQWMDNTCINFTLSESCKEHSERSLNHSVLAGDSIRVGTAAHEIGHALGFFHTHSRHDRDKYITPDWLDQFLLETTETNNNYDLTYDYGSLMHYGTTSATRNEKPTMVPTPDARYGETLGSPFISFYDLLMLNKYYNCMYACKGTKTVCQNEGFPNPRPLLRMHMSQAGMPDDCGREVEATDQWNKLVDSVGENTIFTAREDFKKCHYWIKNSKPGKKIEVKLAYFPASLAVDGCKYAGVEIKTDPDKRRTGYRYAVAFCFKDDITTLRSTLNIVPVITYNRLYFTGDRAALPRRLITFAADVVNIAAVDFKIRPVAGNYRLKGEHLNYSLVIGNLCLFCK
ncbi:astacin [Cooperia oncophora]